MHIVIVVPFRIITLVRQYLKHGCQRKEGYCYDEGISQVEFGETELLDTYEFHCKLC